MDEREPGEGPSEVAPSGPDRAAGEPHGSAGDEPVPPDRPLPGEPEGTGGPGPGPRRHPSTVGGAFYLVLLAVTAAGIVLASVDDWRVGVRWVGGALLAAALLRLVLPERDAGMLAVRHRVTDALLLTTMGAAVLFLAGSVPDQPPPL